MDLRKTIAAGALKLRRLPFIHRFLKWFRRTFLRAMGEAVLEFGRWIWCDNENFGPPQRFFSAYQALRTGDPKINGQILVNDQGCPAVKPDSILVTGGYEQHKEQPSPIFWSEHCDIRLVTESLSMLMKGKSICIESVYGFRRIRDDPAFRFFRLPEAQQLSGNWTSIVSRWVPTTGKHLLMSMPNYTHWLLDALPRLALLSKLPADTKIIVPADLHPNQKESLAMLGVLDRCRPTTERHLKVERYFFSSPTTMLQGYNPYGIDFLRNSFIPKRDQSFKGPKRFFIQRIGLSREPSNADQLEQFFKDEGWIPINVVKLSFAQQVQLFHEADAIAGMFGSGFTNCVFCKPGCQVYSIMPRDCGLDGYLDWISEVVDFTWHPLVIPCGYDFKFSVDLAMVKAWLQDPKSTHAPTG